MFFIEIFLRLIVIYFLAISAGPSAGARFRVPVMPLFSLISAKGFIFSKKHSD